MMKNDGNKKTFRCKYYVLGEKAGLTEDWKAVMKKYIHLKDTFAYDDGFDEWKVMKQTIYELKDDGSFYKCSCPYGLKHYLCKHNIGLSNKTMQSQTQPNPSLYSKKERGVGLSRIKDGGQKNNFLFVILFLKINYIKCLILYLIHVFSPCAY